MKKLLFPVIILLLLTNVITAAERITDIRTSIYKIDVIVPEGGIVLSGSAFCTDVKQVKGGWNVTLTTCAHILYFFEDRHGVPNMQTQFLVHKFYPVPHTFVANKITKKKYKGDTATITYFTTVKPADNPIKFAKELPAEGADIMIFGCPKGLWANIKFYNYLDKNKDYLFLMPSSQTGVSGAPALNEEGLCIGVVSNVNNNFTRCEPVVGGLKPIK